MTLLNSRDFDDLGSEWKADTLLDIEDELRDQAEVEAEAEEKDLENYLQEILDNADLEWRFKADICFCLAGYCEKRAKEEAGD